MRRILLSAVLALAAVVAGTPGARAEVSAVGPDGESYSLLQGAYGDLFPGGAAAGRDSLVLALEIRYRDGAVDRLLVPQTEEPPRDDSASLILEPVSQTPFIVWQAWKNYIHPRLNLVQLTADGWSPVVELSGSPFNLKGSPSFVVTRDRYDLDRHGEGGESVHRERTTVHLVWWERVAEELRVFYSPVVLEDGVYVGRNPVYRLTELSAGLEASGVAMSEALLETLSIQAGEDERSFVVGFADAASGRLVAVEGRVLPGELGVLGDAVRPQLVDLGSRLDLGAPETFDAMSDAVRARLAEVGGRFHPSFLAYLADQLDAFIADWLEAADGGDVESLAGGARAQIVDIGRRLQSGGLDGAGDGGVLIDFSGSAEGSTSHLIALRRAASWSSPATEDAMTRIFVARSGEQILVAWRRLGGIAYRESRGEAWSDEYFLPAGGDADAIAAILRRLDERTRGR